MRPFLKSFLRADFVDHFQRNLGDSKWPPLPVDYLTSVGEIPPDEHVSRDGSNAQAFRDLFESKA